MEIMMPEDDQIPSGLQQTLQMVLNSSQIEEQIQ